MKKVLSLSLIFMLLFSMMTAMPAFADEEVITTVSLAGTSQNANDYVNIILTEKSSSAIKYINQVKTASDGKWNINFKVKGTLSDYNILFRQNGSVDNKIAPEYIQSITPGLSVELSAAIAARTVTASLSINKGNSLEEFSCDVIIASYDKDGNLLDTYSPSVSADADVAKLTETITHELPEDAAYAKVFCWKDLTPLTKSVQAEFLKAVEPPVVPETDPEIPYVQHRGSVGNVFAKLNNGEDVTIGYLGGSVTEGAGVSSDRRQLDPWRARVTQWFKDTYPNNTITESSAAIGGMGSLFGAARLKDQLLVNNPDIIFVMCSINDRGSRETQAQSQRQMEDIIRQIIEYDPEIDIIIGYDTDNAVGQNEEPYEQVVWHEAVAQQYNITSVDMGRYLGDVVRTGEYTFGDVLSDIVHPNGIGYAFYFKPAKECLEDAMANAPEEVVTYTLPSSTSFGKPMNNKLYVPGVNLSAQDGYASQSGTGVAFFSKMFFIRLGTSMTFTIEGENLGLYTAFGASTGNVRCTVDGVDMGEYPISEYSPITRLVEDMGPGPHTVTLTADPACSLQVNALFTWDSDN